LIIIQKGKQIWEEVNKLRQEARDKDATIGRLEKCLGENAEQICELSEEVKDLKKKLASGKEDIERKRFKTTILLQQMHDLEWQLHDISLSDGIV